MKTRLSLRKRIIYWSIGLVGIVITVLCTTSIWAVYQQLLNELDTRLTNEATDIQRSLTVSNGHLLINEDIEWEEEHHQYEMASSIYILILNRDKSEYKRSENIAQKTFPIDMLQFSQKKPFIDTIKWYDTQTRFYTQPLHLATKHMGWIILAMPLDKIFTMLTILSKHYIILFPLCILLGIGGSIFIASRTIKPIQEITDKASLLNHNNLNEPLPIPNTNDEIAFLAVTMNELLNRLRNNFDSIRQFTAHASHELKTPLSVLELELEDLEENLDKTSDVNISPRIRNEIFRMAKIIDDLSILAKADTEHIVLDLQEIWLNDILFSEIERLLPVAKESAVALKIGDTISASIMGDGYWIRVMLSNVIDNAIKYSPSHSTVMCSMESNNSHISLIVSDEGPGVPDDIIPDITKRFYRSSVVSTTPGSGLGLSIVDWVVNNHNGSLQFSNQDPHGLKVSLTLPRLS
ncbi:MAG: HAMP domain-containing histidine kinase [Bacteroidetes bacterium]|nr:HAMP domain-containing histidine kinase [Bacteroidota bacterium]